MQENGSEEITPGGTKKTKTLQIEKPNDGGYRRLVEYFVVISSVAWSPNNGAQQQKQQQSSDKGGSGGGGGNDTDSSFSEWKVEASNEDDDDDEDEFAGHRFRPTITARYPAHDHHDNPLHDNVIFFCHPSGRIVLRTQEVMPKVHYFVATGGTGRRVYGTCLTLWEPHQVKVKKKKKKMKADDKAGKADGGGRDDEQEEEEVREVWLPKCLVILSTYPYVRMFRRF